MKRRTTEIPDKEQVRALVRVVPHEAVDEHEDVAGAREEGDEPDAHAVDRPVEQVADRRDSVSAGLAHAHLGRVPAVLERPEVAGPNNTTKYKYVWGRIQ